MNNNVSALVSGAPFSIGDFLSESIIRMGLWQEGGGLFCKRPINFSKLNGSVFDSSGELTLLTEVLYPLEIVSSLDLVEMEEEVIAGLDVSDATGKLDSSDETGGDLGKWTGFSLENSAS